MPKNNQEAAVKNPINGVVQPATPRRARKRADVGLATAQGKRTVRRGAALAESRGPTWEEIAICAYHLAEDRFRRGESGSTEGDWFEAERRLLRERKT
jgi:hypothetical protein